jgi:thiamine-phosphate pyrophosphorylase
MVNAKEGAAKIVAAAEVKPDCRLYLELPARPSVAFETELGEAASRADIGCVLLRTLSEHPIDPSEARAVVASAQTLGIACLIEEDAKLAISLGADGVHILADAEAYRQARALLGNDANIGDGCGVNRHDAMRLAEMGADYIAFGSGPGGQVPLDQCIELIAWWSEIFVVPCVAWDIARAEDAARLAAAGADFAAMSAQVWREQGAAAAVAFGQAMRRARRAA